VPGGGRVVALGLEQQSPMLLQDDASVVEPFLLKQVPKPPQCLNTFARAGLPGGLEVGDKVGHWFRSSPSLRYGKSGRGLLLKKVRTQ
jgi:hypothetical protein